MATSLPAMLERLDEFLTRHGAPIADGLRPGATARALDAAERELGFPLPLEVRTWFAWHDGVDEDGVERTDLPNGLIPCTLQQALAGRQQWLGPQPPLPADLGYRPAWLPVTQAGNGHLAADCSGTGADRPAPIWFLETAEAWNEPRLPSLTAMVELWLVMIDRGYWRYDAEEEDWAYTYPEIPLQYRVPSVV